MISDVLVGKISVSEMRTALNNNNGSYTGYPVSWRTIKEAREDLILNNLESVMSAKELLIVIKPKGYGFGVKTLKKELSLLEKKGLLYSRLVTRSVGGPHFVYEKKRRFK